MGWRGGEHDDDGGLLMGLGGYFWASRSGTWKCKICGVLGGFWHCFILVCYVC